MFVHLINIYRKYFMVVDIFSACLLATIFTVSTLQDHSITCVNIILRGNRAQVYGVSAAIFSSLFGFVIAAASIVMALVPLPRFKRLRASSSVPFVPQIFMRSINLLGIATVACVAGMIFDRDASGTISPPIRHSFIGMGQIILYVSVWSSLLAVAALIRCVWLLQQIMTIAMAGPESNTPAQQPA